MCRAQWRCSWSTGWFRTLRRWTVARWSKDSWLCARCPGSAHRRPGSTDRPCLVSGTGREGDIHAQQTLSGGDRVAAMHVVELVKQVHGAVFPFGVTGELAGYFGQGVPPVHALGQSMTVITVGSDDRVVRLKRLDRSDGRRFLARVEVAEPSDLRLLIVLLASLFKAAQGYHGRQHVQQAGWLKAIRRLNHTFFTGGGGARPRLVRVSVRQSNSPATCQAPWPFRSNRRLIPKPTFPRSLAYCQNGPSNSGPPC